MKQIRLFLTILILLLTTMGNSYSQNEVKQIADSVPKEAYSVQVNIDLGFGIDFGGIGGKLELEPIKYLRVFFAGGYYFRSLGWNVGLMFKTLPNKRICPNILAMYGINGAFIRNFGYNSNPHNLFSRSFTFGANIDFLIGKYKSYKITASLLVPIRSKELMAVYNSALVDPNVDMRQKLTPVLISIGFGFCL